MTRLTMGDRSDPTAANTVSDLSVRVESRRRGLMSRAAVASEINCVCGQPLDCCHTAYCPRCGVARRWAQSSALQR